MTMFFELAGIAAAIVLVAIFTVGFRDETGGAE